MNILTKISISIIFILFPLICHAQNVRLDSLLNVLENGKRNHLEEFRTLTKVLKTYRNASYFNIHRIKVFYGDKEIREIEHQYRITQVEVNKYLDTILFYIKDPDYKYQFEQFNNQLKIALFSIRDLNTIFSKYDYYMTKPTPDIFIDKPSLIKNVVKHTMELKDSFGGYENGIDRQGQIKITKASYWCDWEDEQLNLRVPKQERK